MRHLIMLLLLCLLSCQAPEQPEATTAALLFVGTYTKKEAHVDGKAEGINCLEADGPGWSAEATTPGIINPSYLTIDEERSLLYAVSEIGPDVDSSGQVVAYQILADGQLKELNRQATHGFAPCYVSLHPDGSSVLVANYVGGTVAVLPRRPDGSLSPASDTLQFTGSGPHAEQEASHPHCILPGPGGQFVFVADKGTDRIEVLNWETAEGQASLSRQSGITVQAGAGPRHLAFHPKQRWLYLINELDATVNAYTLDPATGNLQLLQSITTLPESYQGQNTCADIHLSPDGTYLYASNRGHNSLAIYKVLPDGRLEARGHASTAGEFPRNFLMHPNGKQVLVANQNSDNIVVFDRDTTDGSLSVSEILPSPTPVCLKLYRP